MASRYSSISVLDYCFHPVKVLKDEEYIFVPCGKCDGCRLFKANQWSHRVSYEIEHNPFSIFFTLTYNNHYLPTLVPFKVSDTGDYLYTSNHPLNVRFNGQYEVLRDDSIVFSGKGFVPIENDSRRYTVNYFSKRDVQLWLKLLREDLRRFFNIQNDGTKLFRYYIISEVGPTTHRCHAHGILFPASQEYAERLVDYSMFANWQMCDYGLFRKHTKYCDAGTATYVSNYTTVLNSLPPIYKMHPEIRPFRLSSKTPAIGYSAFDLQKVFEDISVGITTYTRAVSSIGKAYVLGYPSSFVSGWLVKCYRFGTLSYWRLLWIYGLLYRSHLATGQSVVALSARLRQDLHPSDYRATLQCYKVCDLLGCTPFHYLYLLDMYYYKTAMQSLSRWYQWQENNSCFPVKIIKSYNNFSDYVSNRHCLSQASLASVRSFCVGFSIDFDSLDDSTLTILSSHSPEDFAYQAEVSDIVSGLSKIPKVNEMTGNSPHNF